MIDEIFKDLGGYDLGRCVLDVGAGFGRTTRFLLSRGYVVYAVDIDPGVVQSLGAELREFVETGLLKIVHGDVEDLPFSDGECDSVVSVALLHHVRHVERALGEMLRVARRVVLVYDWTPQSAGVTNPHSEYELAAKMREALEAAAGLDFDVYIDRFWYRLRKVIKS